MNPHKNNSERNSNDSIPDDRITHHHNNNDLIYWKQKKKELERTLRQISQKEEKYLYLHQMKKKHGSSTVELQLRVLVEFETKERQKVNLELKEISAKISSIQKEQKKFQTLRLAGALSMLLIIGILLVRVGFEDNGDDANNVLTGAAIYAEENQAKSSAIMVNAPSPTAETTGNSIVNTTVTEAPALADNSNALVVPAPFTENLTQSKAANEVYSLFKIINPLAEGADYSVQMFTFSLQGGEADGTTYEARALTYTQSGLRNASGSSYTANVGFFNQTIPITAPPAPVLVSPINGTAVTSRTPTFVWNNSIDADSDPNISYRLDIDDNIGFTNPEVNVSGILNTTNDNTTYTISTELAVDTTFFWRVFAYDQTEYGINTSPANFTVQSYLAINITDKTAAFETLQDGANVSTPNNASPLRAENVGNIIANITVTGTSFFNAVSIPSTFYRFRIRANESGAFNTTASATEWNETNTTLGVNIFHVINLDWHSISNDFITDLNVSVPLNESPGAKLSTITFTITG